MNTLTVLFHRYDVLRYDLLILYGYQNDRPKLHETLRYTLYVVMEILLTMEILAPSVFFHRVEKIFVRQNLLGSFCLCLLLLRLTAIIQDVPCNLVTSVYHNQQS